MQTKFKRGDKIVLTADVHSDYIEYHNEDDSDFQEIPIKKGMKGKINVLLPNGKYHVEIFDKKGGILAYVPVDEEDLEKE
ncbi:MAG: hypothetical protein AABX85_00840 [Nanoarchaeota archaeon]